MKLLRSTASSITKKDAAVGPNLLAVGLKLPSVGHSVVHSAKSVLAALGTTELNVNNQYGCDIRASITPTKKKSP